jgi:hypothetical protein
MRSPATERTPERDLAQMERWTAWVIRLTSHAAEAATDAGVREHLLGATEDAESLRDALADAASGWLDAGQVAIVRSVYDLWDANLDRIERLAAVVDPIWHRRWRIRSANARPAARSAPFDPSITAVG